MMFIRPVLAVALVIAGVVSSAAQTPAPSPAAAPANGATTRAAAPTIPTGVEPPPGYVIGPDDVLSIVFWREKEMSAESAAVRPDGKISLPLVNDIQAAGLTPEQLRASIAEAAGKFVEDSTVTVVVKAINSRRVYIMGQVGKQGPYGLSGPTTVVQMLATAGGVLEYAKADRITIMRTENGKTVSYRFNYKDFMQGKGLAQNIELKPGDTILVP